MPQPLALVDYVLKLINILAMPIFELRTFKVSLNSLISHIWDKFCRLVICNFKILKLKKQLKNISTAKEWNIITNSLDLLDKSKQDWRLQDKSSNYDFKQISAQRVLLMKLRLSNDFNGLMDLLRQNLQKNFCGISNPELYNVGYACTKSNIEEYQNEVIKCLQFMYYYKGSSNLKQVQSMKTKWFEETRKSFGRSALMLSGGAGMGKYHHGVIKALYEQDLFPRIICGSSAGSIFAACISTVKIHEINIANTYEFVYTHNFIGWKDDSVMGNIQKLIDETPMGSIDTLKNFIRGFTKDLTFLEVYEKNGWILNITATTVNQKLPILFNYLTTPDVLIWSACLCSAAIPEFYGEQEIYMKNTKTGQIEHYHSMDLDLKLGYIDGSISQDIPTKKIAQLFNVSSFIVCQVNPHGSPFLWNMDSSDISTPLDKAYLLCKKFVYNQFTHIINSLDSFGLMEPMTAKGIILAEMSKQCQVVISPNLTSDDYKTLLNNCTKNEFDKAIQQTFLLTMNKIPLIKSVYGIEREFERYYQRLTKKPQLNWLKAIQNIGDEQNELVFRSQPKKKNSFQKHQISLSFEKIIETSCVSTMDYFKSRSLVVTQKEMKPRATKLALSVSFQLRDQSIENTQKFQDPSVYVPRVFRAPSQMSSSQDSNESYISNYDDIINKKEESLVEEGLEFSIYNRKDSQCSVYQNRSDHEDINIFRNDSKVFL